MEKLKVEYYVAKSDSPHGLEEQVRQKLHEGGWEFQGGVSICVVKTESEDDFWFTYVQAMVRRADSK